MPAPSPKGQKFEGYLQTNGAGDVILYNDSETEIARWLAGSNPPNQLSSALTNGYTNTGGDVTTTSATAVSTGVGFGLSSQSSTACYLHFAVSNTNSGTNTNFFSIYRNTTGIPSNGTSVGSDTLLIEVTETVTTAAAITQSDGQVLNSGLTKGTTYFFYIAARTNAGTLTMKAGNQSSIYGLFQ